MRRCDGCEHWRRTRPAPQASSWGVCFGVPPSVPADEADNCFPITGEDQRCPLHSTKAVDAFPALPQGPSSRTREPGRDWR